MDLTTRLFLRRAPEPAYRGLLRARHWLRRARNRLLPANAVTLEATLAVAEPRAIGVAAELDIAGHLADGARSVDDLAAELGTDPDATERLLRLLSGLGYFRRDRRGRWHNTRLSRPLRADHPLSVRDWARFFGGPDLARFWAGADHSIHTGAGAVDAQTGSDFFGWTADEAPEVGALFDAAMRDGSRLTGLSMDREVDLTGVTTVCDVGGGTGRLLADLLADHPDRRGVLFDLPTVVERAPSVLEAAGVADRVDLVGGSFFEGVPGGADRYVLVSVIHDWDDERAVTILTNTRDALDGDARILVVEQVRDPSEAPFISDHSDLLMLVLSGAGRERTNEEFERLFTAAGLRVATTYRLATPQTVFELVPAA